MAAYTVNQTPSRNPDMVIAIGGPDVSEVSSMTERDLRANPFVDFCLPNEGEAPMRNLISACLGETTPDAVRDREIEGCGELNEIPSPYFGGYMDRFLADQDYLPIIQTSRGCPYRCTFCVSGKTSWTKLKTFEMERIKEEVDYISKHAASQYLRLADENFGIQPRDVEIAEYIMGQKKQTGFPDAVSVYTDKHPTDRVKQICTIMKECMPFCISFQSVDSNVLNNIKRINLKDDEIRSAIEYARENDLLLVTELIFPLPGETIESLLYGIDHLLAQRFESIAFSQLTLLKGSEMDWPEDREKYGYVSKFHVSINGYTQTPFLKNVEIDEWVVATNTMSEEDCYRVYKVIFLVDFGHFRGILKELIFLAECHDVHASELFLRCAEDAENCPTLSAYANRCSSEVRQNFHDTREEVEKHVFQYIKKDPERMHGIVQQRDMLAIDLLLEGKLEAAIDEMAGMMKTMMAESSGGVGDEFLEELEAVSELTLKSFIPIEREVPEEISIMSPFDFYAWRKNNYKPGPSAYRHEKAKETTLRVPNMTLYRKIWENEGETVRNKYMKNFFAINSANRRRYISASSPVE